MKGWVKTSYGEFACDYCGDIGKRNLVTPLFCSSECKELWEKDMGIAKKQLSECLF